jgi:hypothetical protein
MARFSRNDFRYDPASDVYYCPDGKRLGTSGTLHEGRTLLYRTSKLDCDVCPVCLIRVDDVMESLKLAE